ncbi:hypothetical protein [Frankia sp. CiP3]|uniref:hypothetical protein n=1 Tax=Frankia sp. CiP3 TaxID=2880971 RepID=UPI001EF59C2B|nr:hypothetical protein [Frankia sp. CiP3]
MATASPGEYVVSLRRWPVALARRGGAFLAAGGYQAGFPPLCPGALGPGRWARM